jgi:hypothetical protein
VIFPPKPVKHRFNALHRIDNTAKAGRMGFAPRVDLQIRQGLPGWRTGIEHTFRDFT